jgi:hypothetical protein
MEDSVEKKPEQPVAEEDDSKAPVESVEMVRHNGKTELTKRIRGEGGKFVKQTKTMPKSEDVTRFLRNVLNSAECEAGGKITQKSRSHIRKMTLNIVKNAEMDAEQPVYNKLGMPVLDADGNQRKVVDPKIMMASAQSYKEIMLRAYGAPSKSDEELNAMKMQSVKIVIIQHPEMMDKVVVEDKPHEAPVPAFIDAEIIENE